MGEAKLRLKGELRSPLQIASRFDGAAAHLQHKFPSNKNNCKTVRKGLFSSFILPFSC
jgi:hypothetical protein